MKKTIKLAIIGYGQRGKGLLTGILTTMAEMDIEIVGVCDFYEIGRRLLQNTYRINLERHLFVLPTIVNYYSGKKSMQF